MDVGAASAHLVHGDAYAAGLGGYFGALLYRAVDACNITREHINKRRCTFCKTVQRCLQHCLGVKRDLISVKRDLIVFKET